MALDVEGVVGGCIITAGSVVHIWTAPLGKHFLKDDRRWRLLTYVRPVFASCRSLGHDDFRQSGSNHFDVLDAHVPLWSIPIVGSPGLITSCCTDQTRVLPREKFLVLNGCAR